MNGSGLIQRNRELLWSVGLSILLVLLILLFAWVLYWLVGQLVNVFIILLMSGFLAFILHPLVRVLERVFRRVPAAILVFLVFLALVFLIFYFLIPTIVREMVVLKNNLPSILASLQGLLNQVDQFLRSLGLGLSWGQLNQQIGQTLQTGLGEIISQVLSAGVGVVSFLVSTVFVLFISFFLLKDWPRLKIVLHAWLAHAFRERTREFLDCVSGLVSRYLGALLLQALIVGVLDALGSWLLGVPYAWFLGIVGFFGEFIPYFGPVIVGGTAILFSLGRPILSLVYIALFFLVVQAFQNYVLSPNILSRQMGFHPVIVVLAVLVGGTLFGFWGAITAVPLVSLARAIYRFFRQIQTFAPSPIERAPDEQQPA